VQVAISNHSQRCCGAMGQLGGAGSHRLVPRLLV
jgi:hypothetical protein